MSVKELKISDINNKIKELLKDILCISDVTDDDIIIYLGIDSLDITEIICSLENEYGIDISEEDSDRIKNESFTVNDLSKFIYNKVNN